MKLDVGGGSIELYQAQFNFCMSKTIEPVGPDDWLREKIGGWTTV
jgi:hypothetical protein